MKYKYIADKKIKYDGTQLQSLWAYQNFDLTGDSIVAFRGGCEVKKENLVDLEDAKRDETIYSEDMLHFIVEIFQLDLEKAILTQRLLITIIKEAIEFFTKISCLRQGDDLFINQKKLSVSIATSSPVSTLIHVGVNIESKNTPLPTMGLKELDINIDTFAHEIISNFVDEIDDIKFARCKVRGVK